MSEKWWELVGPPNPSHARARWDRQYATPSRSSNPADQARTDAITAKLHALGKSPTAEQVDAAIGNNSWTTHHCSGCFERVKDAIELQGDHYQYLCRSCIEAMAKAIAPKWDSAYEWHGNAAWAWTL